MSEKLLFKEKHERQPDGSLSFTVTVVGKITQDNVKQIEDKLTEIFEMGGRSINLVLYEDGWGYLEDEIDEVADRLRDRGCNIELSSIGPRQRIIRYRNK